MIFSHSKRYFEIISKLFRHGSGWLVVKLGIGTMFPFHKGLLGHPRREKPYSAAEHLRMAFEELGTTFIKLAQILSTRPDLISPEYADQFALLQDHVPPIPFVKIQPILEAELGKPYNETFSSFDKEPLSSASIGQVYRATLKNGKKVIIKIQKPGLFEEIHRDIEIFKDIIKIVLRRTNLGERYDFNGLLEEFSFNLLSELDYVREGKNCDRFRQLFKGNPKIFIPTIHWEYTSAKVLVMDEVIGIKISELGNSPLAGKIDRGKLAVTAIEATFKQIFEFGFFHADPHAGNFMVMQNGVLGLIDFGLVGYLDDANKESFLRFSYFLFRGRTDEMLDALWDLGISSSFAMRPALKRDLTHLHYRFKEKTLSDIAASEMIKELMGIVYSHHLHFPSDLALLLKVMAMCEGLGAMINPEFKLFDFAEPYLKEVWQKTFSPANLAQKISTDVYDVLQFSHGLPRRASHLLKRLELGDIKFEMRSTMLEKNTNNIIRAVDRLTIAVMIMLLVMALGIYILAGHFMKFDYYLVKILLALLLAVSVVALRIFINVRKAMKKAQE